MISQPLLVGFCKGIVDAKRIDITDFFKWKYVTSQQKLRPNGAFTLKYKNSFTGEVKTLDSLMTKYVKESQLLKIIDCLQALH